ncbi:hypothetical protein [Methanosarcina siciliae]|uniref:hypothetical protein n=1 Tax=Methanosarcina siciliae TaxID=38027 RepID=UPI0016506BF2|nr:hypothetical protein [Methanosarcina siciliae]
MEFASRAGHLTISQGHESPELTFWVALGAILGFFVCSLRLQAGVERRSKFMMGGQSYGEASFSCF